MIAIGRSEATMIFPAPRENAKSGSGQNINATNDIGAAANAAHAQSTVRLIVINANLQLQYSTNGHSFGHSDLCCQPTRPAIGDTSAVSGNTLLASTLSSMRK